MENLATKRDFRTEVITFLSMLRDHEAQRRFQQRIGDTSLPDELSRLWFDEIYLLSPRYVDGLKGDPSKVGQEEFKKVFSVDELAALERFHRFFELRLSMLDKQSDTIDRFENSLWKHLSKDAHLALAAFED